MNGYEEIDHLIYEQLAKANANIPGGRSKFSKDTAKLIYALIEAEMNPEWNVGHNFPTNLEDVIRRLENGLHFNMWKRTAQTAQVYQFILDEEEKGRPLERFIKWATHPDHIRFTFTYHRDPRRIVADYPQAFVDTLGDRPEFQPFVPAEKEFVPAPRKE